MIEYLRRTSSADVYVARTEAIDITVTENEEKNDEKMHETFKISVDVHGKKEHLALYKLEPNETSYSAVPKQGDIEGNFKTKIDDMSKHNIIIFDSNEANQYHNFVYNELNIILTQLSYDYLTTIGEVPKVSMISHSTGGKWNMMWANRHPLNVGSLQAIAAPFNGTVLGHILYTESETIGKVLFGLGNKLVDGLGKAIHGPSGMDNVDDKQYGQLYKDWEQAIKINPALICYAYAGPTSLKLLAKTLFDSFGADGSTALLHIEVVQKILHALLPFIDAFFGDAPVMAFLITAVTAGSVALTALMSAAPIVGIAVCAALSVAIVELTTSFGSIVQYLVGHIYVDSNGTTAIYDDLTVDVNSALGKNVPSGVNKSPEYMNANTYSNFVHYEKTFRTDNCNDSKRNMNMPAVGHNIEIQDQDIIQNVDMNIEMDVPQTRYNYVKVDDKKVKITSIKDDFDNRNIILPEYLDGCKVVEINNELCKNNEKIESIEFCSNILTIPVSAFERASNLKKAKLNEGLVYISDMAFKDTALEALELPNTVSHIGKHAFFRTNLSNVTLATNKNGESALWDIRQAAFSGTPYIEGTENIILGNVLIKYNSNDKKYTPSKDAGVKFFAEMCFNGSALQEIDLTDFELIKTIVHKV